MAAHYDLGKYRLYSFWVLLCDAYADKRLYWGRGGFILLVNVPLLDILNKLLSDVVGWDVLRGLITRTTGGVAARSALLLDLLVVQGRAG